MTDRVCTHYAMIVWSTLTHNFSMESFHKFYCRAKSPWKERLIFKAFQVLVRIIRYEDTTNFNQYRLYTVQYIYIIHDETLLQNHFFVDLRAQCNYSKIVASYRRKITVFLGETQLSNALQSKPGNAFSFMNLVWEKNEVTETIMFISHE